MKSNYVWLNDKSFTVCEFLKREFWGMILRKYGRHADESSPKRNRALQPLMDGKIASDEWYSVVSREVRNKLYEIEWMKGLNMETVWRASIAQNRVGDKGTQLFVHLRERVDNGTDLDTLNKVNALRINDLSRICAAVCNSVYRNQLQ